MALLRGEHALPLDMGDIRLALDEVSLEVGASGNLHVLDMKMVVRLGQVAGSEYLNTRHN